MDIVWEHLLPCMQCGMILMAQLFVRVLGLIILSISAFSIELAEFSSRSF